LASTSKKKSKPRSEKPRARVNSTVARKKEEGKEKTKNLACRRNWSSRPVLQLCTSQSLASGEEKSAASHTESLGGGGNTKAVIALRSPKGGAKNLITGGRGNHRKFEPEDSSKSEGSEL